MAQIVERLVKSLEAQTVQQYVKLYEQKKQRRAERKARQEAEDTGDAEGIDVIPVHETDTEGDVSVLVNNDCKGESGSEERIEDDTKVDECDAVPLPDPETRALVPDITLVDDADEKMGV